MPSTELYLASAILLLSLLFLTKLTTKKSAFSSLPLPPGPPALPLIGNLHQSPKTHPWFQFHTWSQSYGPILHLNMAGQSVIVLSTNKTSHDLLAKQGATFSDRPHFVVAHELALQGMHMLLRPYDQRFKLHQKLESPVLSEKAAKAYLPIQDLESKQLLLDLLTPPSNPLINPHDAIERMTASIIYTLFYSHRVHTASDPILLQAHLVNHEFDQLAQVGKYLVDSFPLLNHLPPFLAPWKSEAASHWQKQRALHVGNLDRGLESKSWNVTKQMQQSVDSMSDIIMPADELALNIGIMADAALDASTETMMWFVVACLTEGHRGWVAKAQKDIDAVVGRSRLPSFEDRPALPYINAVVEELLRWRPAGAAGVPHFTKVESSYEGYRIPANSVVIPNHWSITREEAVFGPNVEDFVPERWLGEELPTIGFGYGRRICPGRHVARNSLWIAVVRLLWAYDIQPELNKQGEPVKVDTKGTDGLVTKPLPFKARFVPRGDWVKEIVRRDCDTWKVDHLQTLDEIAASVFR
ncbi:putative cytochrome P450 E-class, group I [Triangularia verruculosa]|uniref:Cytochrome P450 E-class, group I n=1 Tax=Triangularia verruculosa TaxID=2587418 RepID=A0AAN6XRT7_9PEZI|nr:putative cytochrome P450 E-class, group I [Triangularia verruculosa]